MAHIVPFRTAAARESEEAEVSQAESAAQSALGAQIIIFPGVRRERTAEPPADSLDSAKDPMRDWLELPDGPASTIL